MGCSWEGEGRCGISDWLVILFSSALALGFYISQLSLYVFTVCGCCGANTVDG